MVALNPDLDSKAALIGAQAILGLTFVATALFVAGALADRSAAWSALGLRPFRRKAFGAMLLAYSVYLAAVVIYSAVFGAPEQQDIARDLGLGSGPITAVLSVILIAGLAPVAEELFFRGMLFGGLRTRFAFWPAALGSGLLFGSLHLPTGPEAVPPLIFLGLTLAWLYERTGSLWPPIIVHTVNNSLALALTS